MGDANLAYRAAKANRSAALAAALPILAQHQARGAWGKDDSGIFAVCSCKARINGDDLDTAMAQHQIDAVRGGK